MLFLELGCFREPILYTSLPDQLRGEQESLPWHFLSYVFLEYGFMLQ